MLVPMTKLPKLYIPDKIWHDNFCCYGKWNYSIISL